MSISHIWQKIKGLARMALETTGRRDIYGSIVIALTSLSAFYMGRIVDLEASRPPVEFRTIPLPKAPQEAVSAPIQASSAQDGGAGKGKYVASRNSSKYHLAECPGARTISEANKVWFSTKEAAEAAGYAPAANCPGI